MALPLLWSLEIKKAMTLSDIKLEVSRQARGRALFISAAGSLYVSWGYSIYRSDDGGQVWNLDCRIPCGGWMPMVSRCPLAVRALRFCIQALQVLPDGARVAVVRDGIYRASAGEIQMSRTWAVKRGARPINLSADGNRLLFGEYGRAEMDHVKVRLYASDDGGGHFEPVYEFPKGDVHHIHNVVVDPYSDHYWVLAGDHGRTPGIGAFSKDLQHFDWVERGSQMVRAVSVLVRPDCLIYGSDTEMERNFIVRLDRKSGRYERLMPLDGSSLYAADFGKFAVISTCVEPSKINKSRDSNLLVSMDDVNWTSQISMRKDLWSSTLFQFGLIVLPSVQQSLPPFAVFSGQALKGNHDRVSICRLESQV